MVVDKMASDPAVIPIFFLCFQSKELILADFGMFESFADIP